MSEKEDILDTIQPNVLILQTRKLKPRENK